MTNGKMISGLVRGQLAAVESMDEVGFLFAVFLASL